MLPLKYVLHLSLNEFADQHVVTADHVIKNLFEACVAFEVTWLNSFATQATWRLNSRR